MIVSNSLLYECNPLESDESDEEGEEKFSDEDEDGIDFFVDDFDESVDSDFYKHDTSDSDTLKSDTDEDYEPVSSDEKIQVEIDEDNNCGLDEESMDEESMEERPDSSESDIDIDYNSSDLFDDSSSSELRSCRSAYGQVETGDYIVSRAVDG